MRMMSWNSDFVEQGVNAPGTAATRIARESEDTAPTPANSGSEPGRVPGPEPTERDRRHPPTVVPLESNR